MRRRPAAALLLPLALTACSGSTAADRPAASPSCPPGGTVLPARCVSTATPSADAYSSDPGAIAPVDPAPPAAGQVLLGAADNTAAPSRTTATFTVTVPGGSRIGSEDYCRGNGELRLTTVPDSDAFQSFTCNSGAGQQSTLTSESAVPVTTPTTYVVTVRATGASRWSVRVYGTTAPVATVN